LHQAEEWRDRLLADDDAFTEWLQLDPQAEAQPLRALIRQARKDAQAVSEKPGEAQRHGKAYRELFQAVRATLGRKNELDPAEPTADTPTDTDAE
jgi:ribosome-associated protein